MNQEVVKNFPILNKETTAIWSAWSRMGNREVAREAAAKGTHVELAIQFLSKRIEISIKDAENWFKTEVSKWVKELLERKQIHRSKHILSNAKIDAISELREIFLKTSSGELINYIGEHLKELKELDEPTENLWKFLEIIKKNTSFHCNSIEDLTFKTQDWRSRTASILFLTSFDIHLTSFINPLDLFKHLINSNNILIKYWINISYEESGENVDNMNEFLLNFFSTNHITSEMLNFLATCEQNHFLNVNVLNQLCKYGVILKNETEDFIKLLNRFLSNDITKIYTILQEKTSTVSVNEFVTSLNEYCFENNTFTVLSACLQHLNLENVTIKSQHVDLLRKYRKLEWNSKESLRNNIFSTVNFIKNNNDYKEYFDKNPLVLCTLIMLCENVEFLNIKPGNVYVESQEISKYYNAITSKYNFVRKLTTDAPKTRKNFYNLLEDHLKINVEKLIRTPSLNCDKLVQFAYQKSLDYIFYIHELRPSIAAKLTIIEQLNSQRDLDDLNDKLQKQCRKVFKLAINNFDAKELACSCVCFNEMIGISSENLRVHLHIANIIQESIYQENYTSKDMLRNFENAPDEIQTVLEKIALENVDFSSFTAKEFVEAKNAYEVIVKFSRENGLKLPENFLRNCAMNNDWFSFMIFAQIYNYPIEQIQEVLQCFKNPFYLEHVLHSVKYDVEIEDGNNVVMKEHSRFDLFKNSQTNESILEIDILNTKATLLQTLIRCHNSADPPRALLQACQLYRSPLLAILATSYEPDSIHTNWLTWLVVSCELCPNFTNLEGVVLSAVTTRELLNNAMEKGFPRTLLKSFEIFLPDNSLKYFLKFLCEAVKNNDLEIMAEQLKLFETSLKNCRKSSVFSEADHDITYLTNRSWIEETALMLLASVLKFNINSAFQQMNFLKTCDNLKLQEIWTMDSPPNFTKILQITSVLYENRCENFLDFTKVFRENQHKESIIQCINNLLEMKLFEVAIQIAEIENLPKDLVILLEWEDKFENLDDNDDNFWKNCNNSFKEHNVTADRVIEFYMKIHEELENDLKKFEISRYSYEWAREFQLSNRYELEKQMWLDYISLEEKPSFEIHPEIFLYKDMLDLLDQVPVCSLPHPDTSDIENLTIQALEKNDFFLALRLEKMFVIENPDVEILKLCYSLAEGIQTPYQLNVKERMLLNKVSNFRRYSSNRRTLLSSRLSSISSISSHSPSSSFIPFETTTPMIDYSSSQDTLTIIQTLSEKLEKGCEIATNILMMYRVSINIKIPYNLIVCNPDEMALLKNALEMDCSNKLEVIHDFISIYKWDKNQVSNLIFDELINNLNYQSKSKTEQPTMWDLNLNNDFHYILHFLQDDCSILGYKIFKHAHTLFKSHIISSSSELKISELAFIIELIIKSHDCFTSDCNMEGISLILSKSQALIMHLVTLRSWKFIVRLLTGIARYTEMNYVFQILKENDQFEFLLMKGSRQDSALKIALLKYLKKYCPDNRELYKMVALHFALFSEVALLWERDAKSIIKNLIGISKLEMQNNKMNPDTEPYVIFTNTDGTRLCLSKAMENYTHATEFHLQGDKLTKAMQTAKQAELLAVQLSLFNTIPAASSTAICILELEQSQILNLISSQLSFEQSLILVEAYNFSTDWGLVLFKQCIQQNNMTYLEHFLNHLPLTETITRDICRRFLANFNSIIAEGEENMKVLLNKIPSVHAKYQIASELGFSDIIEDLITTGQLCYLKDTVWKRGYKN